MVKTMERFHSFHLSSAEVVLGLGLGLALGEQRAGLVVRQKTINIDDICPYMTYVWWLFGTRGAIMYSAHEPLQIINSAKA